MTYDALVIAGGRARRLGGADKPALTVGGRTLLDRTLAACADAARTVVVGPRRPTHRPVEWTRERRPGAGPLAALDAGLRASTAPTLLVLSADLPFLRPVTVAALLRGLRTDGVEAALAHDPADGRDQPLLAAYHREPLERELALIAAEHGRLDHLPLRLLVPELVVARVPLPAHGDPTGGPPDTADCDTWDDLAAARGHIREHGRMLDEWIAALKAELDLDLDVDQALLLDLARDAAHSVTRPAAPLTTFLIGYAAARGGGTTEDIARAALRAAALAERWGEEQEKSTPNAPRGEDGQNEPTDTSRPRASGSASRTEEPTDTSRADEPDETGGTDRPGSAGEQNGTGNGEGVAGVRSPAPQEPPD
ncbi:molybdenum cofactor guanylyltransferase [Streptomyces sp. XM4193]|uniref:NTP transferase domain-containing protein n=1 Tax=Streptomyces sp. XM4193 TaxID=2929782 RepID=UPI001FF9CE00|nr:NTP transferase domain-containing protein [Streptomyces sp. XM4193]MCK1794512.1 molybdenum cofactor guanylyltransferase [Streptomyces sp. XM4193]